MVAPYKRAKRVASSVYEIVAEVCKNELADPRLKGVQLTGAEMTDDLQIVKIYYFIEGSEALKKKAREGLESATGYLKRVISERMDLRKIPDIMYHFDDSIERAERIDEILKELRESGQMGDDE